MTSRQHITNNIANSKRLLRLNPPETPQWRRHGAPAGPWPWTDFDEIDGEKPQADTCPEGWRGYPQSLFPNWSPAQVKRSGIRHAITSSHKSECIVRCVDIKDKLPFTLVEDRTVKVNEEEAFWEDINMDGFRPAGVRARALFLDRPLGSVLQMIGTKYKIEPFFFSSSLNRIPSRYQEENIGQGDHITITLPFIRIIRDIIPPISGQKSVPHSPDMHKGTALPISNGYLEHELLAIHMIRSPGSSTIISFHPENSRPTAAKHLQSRILDASHSVYWTNILENTSDPTFLLLIYLWYALYAWDQALEDLYKYISQLEVDTITKHDTESAQTLHNVHAHLLSYTALLRDFRKSVKFVQKTPNPAMDDTSQNQDNSRLVQECRRLTSEISRLEMGRQTHAERLKNATNLLFNSVNIQDSTQMRRLTSVAVRDSRTMRQVSILTMIFLPASFAATVFGMNIRDLDAGPDIKGTLAHYFETAIPLTALTIWVVVASQAEPPGSRASRIGWKKLAWPIDLLNVLMSHWVGKKGVQDNIEMGF